MWQQATSKDERRTTEHYPTSSVSIGIRSITALLIVVAPPISLYLTYDAYPGAAPLLLLTLLALQLILVWEMLYALNLAPILVPHFSSGGTTSIVSVLLNNERELIVDTLRSNLADLVSDNGDEIIVAYRCHGVLPEEEQLKELARTNPQLRVMKIVTGHGKSEQMNEAIEAARNDTIRFLDADAIIVNKRMQRHDSILNRADVHFTQGTNLIRNSDSILAKIAGVEYVVKYLVAQYARHGAVGLTYFCGSNGTWQKSIISTIRFSNASLVEDVEASLRADMAGYKGAFLPMMLSTELAPNRLADWWHQRKRWAHGWFEAGALHWRALVRADMPTLKKLNWIYLIWVRRGVYSTIYCWFLLYSVASLLADRPEPALYFSVMLVWQWFLAGSQALTAKRQLRIVTGQKLPRNSILYYTVAFPVYDGLKNLVTLAGWAAWLAGSREWRVTPRR